MFMRLNNGAISGNMGSMKSYVVQVLVIAIMAVMLIACLVSGFVYWHKKEGSETRAEKVKYCITAFMSICMLVKCSPV